MERQLAERYANLEQWHWWFRGRQRILEALLRRELTGQAPLSLASVGCGPAEGLRWLLPLVGSKGRVVGLDLDPLHARHPPPGIEFVVAKLEAAPLASAAFDVVLALDVLEHLDDDTAALRETARLLARGGLLLVTVPALPSLWGGQDVVNHHRRRYTKHTLRQLFTRAKLPAPSITAFNTLLFPPVAMVRWTHRALGQAQRAQSDFEHSHPGRMNELLATLFAMERHLVGRVPLPVGVSLLAMLRMPGS